MAFVVLRFTGVLRFAGAFGFDDCFDFAGAGDTHPRRDSGFGAEAAIRRLFQVLTPPGRGKT